jgi:hypothetical protein
VENTPLVSAWVVASCQYNLSQRKMYGLPNGLAPKGYIYVIAPHFCVESLTKSAGCFFGKKRG